MAYPTSVTNTGANLTTQDANNAAQLWKQGADMFETTHDIFTEFEGGPESLIQVETDLAAGHGQKIHFRVKSGFYGPGRVGNQLYTDPSHFEELKMSSNELTVGLIRNAVSSFFMLEEDVGMRGELESGFNEQLGEWMGREKSAQMGLSALHQCDIRNHLVANGRGDIWSLATGDGLSPDDIVTCGAMLSSMGGKPAEIKLDGMKNTIRKFMFLTTQQGSASLETDPDYKARLLAATSNEGTKSALFEGGLQHVNGHMVRKWDVVDHDGVGPVGSFLSPKAYLGLPIVDGTTANLTGTGRGITGGGDSDSAGKTVMQFFRDFPRAITDPIRPGFANVKVGVAEHALHRSHRVPLADGQMRSRNVSPRRPLRNDVFFGELRLVLALRHVREPWELHRRGLVVRVLLRLGRSFVV